ncbi:MAG TPA: rRNA maturation RNase YbeY [Chlamydiales bacterium]|nr:rRNA maturation RNase YbeY [Chlamydiales bacterium]
MKVDLTILSRPHQLSKKHITKQVKAVLENEGVFCDEVSIVFVDTKTIKEMHQIHFNDPTTTDCITFPIDEEDSLDYQYLGEVFVCPETAITYAEKHSICPFDETTLYLIHGLMHLIGYDDIQEKDKEIMRKKEKYYMQLLKDNKLGICAKHTKLWA